MISTTYSNRNAWQQLVYGPKGWILFLAVSILSISIKLWLSTFGHNYDIESWEIAASLIRSGKSVYANTERYNYGPIIFYVLGSLSWLKDVLAMPEHRESYHFLVAFFLAIVDLGIAAFLYAKKYREPAIIFSLLPVSWVITGFHSQFDQFPVAVGLLAIWVLYAHPEKRSSPLFSALIVGLSLVVKHCLFFFPLWLAFWIYERKKTVLPALTVLCVPYLVFAFSFLPWIFDPASRVGIRQNVLMYKSDYLYALIPKIFHPFKIDLALEYLFAWVPIFSGYKLLWLLSTILVGWMIRKKSVLELYLIYLLALIVLTPALSDQYLTIPMLACAFYWRSNLVKGYVLFGTIFLYLFSPTNIAVSESFKPFTHLLMETIPFRRYFGVAFLAIFLFQLVFKNRKNDFFSVFESKA